MVSAVRTTISFKLTSPETDNSIKIYTPAGELVRKIDSDDIVARYVEDNEVVYQAVWNLKNDAGNSVASGVYIYQVESGDKRRTGRMAIIR